MARLLVVSHDFSLTGAPIALQKLLTSLRDRFEFHVVSHYDGPMRAVFKEGGIDAAVVPFVHTKLEVCTEALAPYDGLVANTLLSMVSIRTAVELGKPSLLIVHEGLDWQHLLAKTAPVSTAIIGMTTRLATPCHFGRRLYFPWRRTPIDVVPWGIEPMPLREPSPLGGQMKVLILGSIQRRKGHDIALEAMRGLSNQNVVLNIVGGPDGPGFHHQITSQYGDLRNVIWRGAIPREKVPDAIANCDVLIVPSRDELTPLVILEAMALGKPVIASDVGGIPEMMEDGETGYLFPSEDSAELARLIKRLERDRELAQRMGEKGRRFVMEHRTHAQCAERYATILDEMLSATTVPVEAAG